MPMDPETLAGLIATGGALVGGVAGAVGGGRKAKVVDTDLEVLKAKIAAANTARDERFGRIESDLEKRAITAETDRGALLEALHKTEALERYIGEGERYVKAMEQRHDAAMRDISTKLGQMDGRIEGHVAQALTPIRDAINQMQQWQTDQTNKIREFYSGPMVSMANDVAQLKADMTALKMMLQQNGSGRQG